MSSIMRGKLGRRLDAIAARLKAVSCRARALHLEPEQEESLAEDPANRLTVIEMTLEALEERMHKIETELRDKRSPPETFGSTNQFSTGPHYPGLG
jgi:hypothetical protein